MASSTEGAFPSPSRPTEAEWRLLLVGVVGERRTVYGEGPNPVPAATGEAVLVAENVGRTEPILVTVQNIGVPVLAAFGRNSGVSLATGLQHAFPADGTSFRQILMPNDRLFVFNAGALTTFAVFKTVV